ncbi:MAG: PRC-barrel domain-containing protein [Gemmobacter sp.]
MQQQGLIPEAAQNRSSTVTSTDVNGTQVYSPAGEHLGAIDHLVIDKASGNIAYAVMSFGGFLGIGADHHPIPWKKLRYDTRLGGYVTDITRDQLEGAPARPDDWRDNRDWAAKNHGYYGTAPYWM